MQEQAYEDAGLLSYEYQELESSGDYTPGSVSLGKFFIEPKGWSARIPQPRSVDP